MIKPPAVHHLTDWASHTMLSLCLAMVLLFAVAAVVPWFAVRLDPDEIRLGQLPGVDVDHVFPLSVAWARFQTHLRGPSSTSEAI